jgi:hypothetical protein
MLPLRLAGSESNTGLAQSDDPISLPEKPLQKLPLRSSEGERVAGKS